MSKIEWTEETWNIVSGCTKHSEGCKNCYAERMTKRLAAMGQKKYAEGFNKVVFHPEELSRNFGKKPKIVFVNSMSDTFHKDLTQFQIADIITACSFQPQHTFQILTKRAERLVELDFYYPENIWLGVTVENIEHKNRIDCLRKTDAKTKFLSCEPLLGDLGELDLTEIDWVIAGGESGPNARSCHPDWIRNIQRQCQEQNVPFFFKQWGEWCPASQIDYNIAVQNFKVVDGLILNVQLDQQTSSYKVGKKNSGCLLDGKTYKEYPKIFTGGQNA